MRTWKRTKHVVNPHTRTNCDDIFDHHLTHLGITESVKTVTDMNVCDMQNLTVKSVNLKGPQNTKVHMDAAFVMSLPQHQ